MAVLILASLGFTSNTLQDLCTPDCSDRSECSERHLHSLETDKDVRNQMGVVGNNDRCSLRIVGNELPLRSIETFNSVNPSLSQFKGVHNSVNSIMQTQTPVRGISRSRLFPKLRGVVASPDLSRILATREMPLPQRIFMNTSQSIQPSYHAVS